jgi:rubrerythrin
MPEFANSLTGLNLDRTLTNEELVRAIRGMIADEYEAIEMYGRVRDATKQEEIRKAIDSVIKEERIHAGEFLAILSHLDPQEAEFYRQGVKEAQENLQSEPKHLAQIQKEFLKLSKTTIS